MLETHNKYPVFFFSEPSAPVIADVNAGSTSSVIVRWTPASGSIQVSERSPRVKWVLALGRETC